jgi:hypothetical protein
VKICRAFLHCHLSTSFSHSIFILFFLLIFFYSSSSSSLQMQCHASPIYTLARNPSFCKNFITVGDWNARIWSEDCKESSIIWTKYCSVDLTDGCWSPTKCSLFYLSRIDGNLEAWDLLQQQSEPILTMKVCMHFLSHLKHTLFHSLSFL